MGFFKKIFGGKKDELREPADISGLKVDIHSHLIPGIDDGAKTMEETIELLKSFQELGYQKVITTPHVMSDYYKNTPEIILSGLKKVREAKIKAQLTIEVEAAAEYNLDADFESLIDQGNLLTFGENYVLFELPFFQEPPMLNDIIWKLQTQGYTPVLAHVERYAFWFDNWEKIQEIKDRGVLFQLNINSLTGHYGPEVKKMAEKLIDNNYINFIGSDCHNMNHFSLTQKALTLPYFHKIIHAENILNKTL
ncbi:MAG: histidinol phosphatase [Flavobacteriales bacterium]|nr:histidinol phosphatase [Flavobacteriales bacterium]